MSVINKMLRDLDHRQAVRAPLSAGTSVAPQAPLRRGTTSIGRVPGASSSQSRRWAWIGLSGLLATAGAGWWGWMQASTPVAATLASSGASAGQNAPASAPIATVATLPSMPPPSVNSVVTPPEVNRAPVLRTEVASARPDPAVVPEVVVASTAVAPVATVQADTAPVVQRQQQAGGDVIAQAQNLWNSGSRDAAIELMQQSIAASERTAQDGAGANPGLLLTPLVREMARMQLAEGRYGAVWDMLTRLEALLGNQPDLWAIRANAAQRLGRHQDSVHAYLVALQSRPDEQRWLLGTAVSLAALGQTSSAVEMAEKARVVGPISKDILAYLRQAGVVFND